MREIRFRPQLCYSVHKETCSEIFCCEHEYVACECCKDWKAYREGEEIAALLEATDALMPKRKLKLTDRILIKIRRWKFSAILWWKSR